MDHPGCRPQKTWGARTNAPLALALHDYGSDDENPAKALADEDDEDEITVRAKAARTRTRTNAAREAKRKRSMEKATVREDRPDRLIKAKVGRARGV